MSSVEATDVSLDDEVEAVASVEVSAPSDGGGPGGGPFGRPVPEVPEVEEVPDVPSADAVALVLPRSLASVVSRLLSCFRSAPSVPDDEDVEDAVVLPLVDEEDAVSSSSEARGLAASLEEVDVEDASVVGGGPGGGPPAPCALTSVPDEPSPLDPESSLLSEPPVCICDSTDIRFDIAELSPLASTEDVWVEVEVAEVDDEVDAVVEAVVIAWVVAAFWLCAKW